VLEEIDRLLQHVLNGDEGGIFAKIKASRPGAIQYEIG
jgi:hypothetical protein